MIDDGLHLGTAHEVARDDLGDAVAAAVRGDAWGWEELFDRHYNAVHRYVMARLGDPHAADEVTQEVFLAAVGAINGLRDRRVPAVSAWFLRIARHKVTDHIRSAVRQRRELNLAVAAGVDPGAVATDNIHAERVRSALDVLTEDQRDVVIRRFVLDQSLEEVAAAMQRPVGAIKSMQHRALAQLAKRMTLGDE